MMTDTEKFLERYPERNLFAVRVTPDHFFESESM